MTTPASADSGDGAAEILRDIEKQIERRLFRIDGCSPAVVSKRDGRGGRPVLKTNSVERDVECAVACGHTEGSL